MGPVFRWGIVGTGNIAKQFARALRDTPHAELVAVGSRSAERADDFGHNFGITHCHEGYSALVSDPIVDVVYIATPHSLHMENTLLALEAGKPVLCEKPFAINADQAQKMIAMAQSKGLFLMEAMWTRFLPGFAKLRELLAEGAIGEVRFVAADLGMHLEPTPGSRVYDLNLGGGCLLDLGVYPVSLAHMVLGKPSAICGQARFGSTGVDEDDCVTLSFEGGALASLYASVTAKTPQQAHVIGTNGRISLESHWWRGDSLHMRIGDSTSVIAMPTEHSGYQYEACEVVRCLHEQKLQSAIMSWEDSLNVMRTMDELRRQWRLKYPME